MIRCWPLLLVLLLGACSHPAPLPVAAPALDWPLQLHVLRQQDELRQDWLLVVQREDGALRWSLLDPLGIPRARQLLVQQDWQNDGLLPPNPEARELFAALLFALMPAEELAQRYPSVRWTADDKARQLFDNGRPRWRVAYRAPLDFDLVAADGLHYRVTALPAHERGATP